MSQLSVTALVSLSIIFVATAASGVRAEPAGVAVWEEPRLVTQTYANWEQTFTALQTGDSVSLNPQPLPPKLKLKRRWTLTFGESVMLNPQPLPPRVLSFSQL